ncbi:4'-phosphopantetheinyl transferase family protein [Streptomyces sp. NPDC057638]|uniref:4'-phosphopantetheinyl transferase family protein n=1 Tax=Streptomyces sp. NPDC057638 TaxID=3346190 RepID=UPI00368F6565
MTPLQIAPGVWALTRPATPHADPHPADRAAADGMADWRAREFLAGRAALRHLLAEVAPDAAELPVVRGHHGRPLLAGRPDLGISVSHDAGQTAAAVAFGRAVGVDVQRPPERLDPRMVRRCVRAGHATLAALPPAEQGVEFAWIWTAQEACVKAEGTGLSGAPWRVDVRPRQTRGTWKGFTWRALRDHGDHGDHTALSAIPVSCAWEVSR